MYSSAVILGLRDILIEKHSSYVSFLGKVLYVQSMNLDSDVRDYISKKSEEFKKSSNRGYWGIMVWSRTQLEASKDQPRRFESIQKIELGARGDRVRYVSMEPSVRLYYSNINIAEWVEERMIVVPLDGEMKFSVGGVENTASITEFRIQGFGVEDVTESSRVAYVDLTMKIRYSISYAEMEYRLIQEIGESITLL